MVLTKDNWSTAFATDADGNVILNTLVTTGAGTQSLKGLDNELTDVIDPATGKMRILVV